MRASFEAVIILYVAHIVFLPYKECMDTMHRLDQIEDLMLLLLARFDELSDEMWDGREELKNTQGVIRRAGEIFVQA